MMMTMRTLLSPSVARQLPQRARLEGREVMLVHAVDVEMSVHASAGAGDRAAIVSWRRLGRFARSECRVSDAPAASPVRGCRRFVFSLVHSTALEASAGARGRDVTAASGGHGLAGAGGLFVAATVQNEDTNSLLHLPQLLSNR